MDDVVEREVNDEWDAVHEGRVEKEQAEEKYMPSNEKTKSRIEESKVKNRYGKIARMLNEHDIVLNEAPKLIIYLNIVIQQEYFQQNLMIVELRGYLSLSL